MTAPMTASPILGSHRDLLERPLYAHVAIIRPDGSPQVNPMWFSYDGQSIRLTHTRTRQKYRNLMANPAIAMSVNDPDEPYRYLEIRGLLDHVGADPAGEFSRLLSQRYGRGDLPRRTRPAGWC